MKFVVSQASSSSSEHAASHAKAETQAEARIDTFVLWLLIAFVLWRIINIAIADIDDVIYRLTDDSYYYFNTARNIVLGFGVTFDRINPTNGFHPLWMVLLLPIYAWAGTDIETPLRIINILLALIAGASIWITYQIVRNWLGRYAAACTAVFMFHPLVMNYFFNGLETGLFLLVTLLVVRVEQQWRLTTDGGGFSRHVIFGGLLGLMFLSRLDSIFLILAVFVAWFFRSLHASERGGVILRVAGLMVAGMTFSTLGGAYFAWNYLTLGHLMPISGALKSSFPHVTLSFESLTSINGFFHLTGVVGFWGLWLWSFIDRHSPLQRLMRSGNEQSGVSLFLPLWFGATGQFFYELLFTKWGAQWWHFAAQIVPLLFLASLIFTFLKQWSKRPIAVPLLTAVAFFSLLFAILEPKLRGAHHEPWWDAVAWVKKNTSPDAVFAMTDSGFFGYFSGRRTINLDGVINSYAFQEALHQGAVATFLREAGVRYVVDYEVPLSRNEEHQLELKKQRSESESLAEADTLTLENAAGEPEENPVHKIRLKDRLFPDGRRTDILTTPQAEVYHSAPYADYIRNTKKSGYVAFVIWRFDQLTVVDRVS